MLAEPAMTNVGIVHPQPGYHEALRELTREYGTLLIIDETHTICAGPGGYTRAENLDPDILVFGKAIGGGVPGAAYGFSQEVADRIVAKQELENCDVGGIGGTLAGNALSLAAMRATLTKVLTKEAFDRMIPMAERWTAGVAKAIAEAELPWHVTRLGCRAEYLFGPEPKNGAQAHDAMDFELERFMHLYAMNRGILLTPFHNMALMSPQTEAEDVDKHTKVFREAVRGARLAMEDDPVMRGHSISSNVLLGCFLLHETDRFEGTVACLCADAMCGLRNGRAATTSFARSAQAAVGFTRSPQRRPRFSHLDASNYDYRQAVDS